MGNASKLAKKIIENAGVINAQHKYEKSKSKRGAPENVAAERELTAAKTRGGEVAQGRRRDTADALKRVPPQIGMAQGKVSEIPRNPNTTGKSLQRKNTMNMARRTELARLRALNERARRQEAYNARKRVMIDEQERKKAVARAAATRAAAAAAAGTNGLRRQGRVTTGGPRLKGAGYISKK